jgi:hypothetical protein
VDSLFHAAVGVDLDLSVQGPPKSDWQPELQFAPPGLLPNRFKRPLPEQVQLELAHRSFETEQKPIVKYAWIVDTIRIDNNSANQTT